MSLEQTHLTYEQRRLVSLFVTNSLEITFDSIKELVCKNQSNKIAVDQLQFKTSKKDWSIKTNIIQKQRV